MQNYQCQPKASHFIGGEFINDESGEEFFSTHPATNEPVAKLNMASDKIIEQAISCARQAQREWANVPFVERARILNEASKIVRSKNDEIAKLETMDTGKAIQETLVVDAASAADNLEYFAAICATLTNEQIPIDESAFAYTLREPLGVVGAVGAWNYPIQTCSWKLAPSIAMGNALIFKPSEFTPLSALMLAECMQEAGLPNGLFNVLQGDGRVGAKIIANGGIAKVSLTGSVATGKKIMASAAENLKHVSLELGGKSPLIIFNDADVENAVSGAIMANFYSTGQVCSNATRVFVEEKIKPAFVERLVERTKKIKIGNPLDEATQMGPMVSKQQLEKVLGYIELGKKEGAKLLCGGNRINMQGMEQGHFIEPTIFDNVKDEMTIAREEIFGPVLSLLEFKSETEAVERANNTEFGLAAGIFTKDIQRAHRVIKKLEAGTTYINNFNLTPAGVPFGGYKMSGIGRENAKQALDSYSQIKSVYVEMGDVDAAY